MEPGNEARSSVVLIKWQVLSELILCFVFRLSFRSLIPMLLSVHRRSLGTRLNLHHMD